jgi:glycosyltransferase involved in cell wall biosynthesis
MLFSIIVLVHKTDLPLLKRCFRSIQEQSFSDFECVIVCDDGSSPDDILPKDSRFKMVSVSACSVGKARNAGLSASLGSYIVFVDSDDMIAPSFLLGAFNLLQKKKYDLICFGCSRNIDSVFSSKLDMALGSDLNEAQKQKAFLDGIFVDSANNKLVVPLTCWGKIFSKETLSQNLVRFCDGLGIGEDVQFVAAFSVVSSKCYLNLPFVAYFYCDRSDSAMKTINTDFSWLEIGAQETIKTLSLPSVDPIYLKSAPKYYLSNLVHLCFRVFSTNGVCTRKDGKRMLRTAFPKNGALSHLIRPSSFKGLQRKLLSFALHYRLFGFAFFLIKMIYNSFLKQGKAASV